MGNIELLNEMQKKLQDAFLDQQNKCAKLNRDAVWIVISSFIAELFKGDSGIV